MRSLLRAAALAAVVVLSIMPALAPIVAFAQEASSTASSAPADTVVTVPWGDWLGGLLGGASGILGVLLLALLTWASKFLPATLQAYITAERIKQVEQLLERAVDYGLNKLADETRGKTVDIDVRNPAIEDALQYAIDHGPAKLIAWMGGEDAIRQKIIARLPVPLPAASTP